MLYFVTLAAWHECQQAESMADLGQIQSRPTIVNKDKVSQSLPIIFLLHKGTGITRLHYFTLHYYPIFFGKVCLWTCIYVCVLSIN